MRYSATANYALDTRKAKGGKVSEMINGVTIDRSLYPLKIRITFARKSRYYLLDKDFYLTLEEFQIIENSKKPHLIDARRMMHKKLVESNEILDRIRDNFTFEEFNRIYYSKTKSTTDVYTVFEEYISLLRSKNKNSTADNYSDVLKSLKKHRKILYFKDVNQNFLSTYGKSFRKKIIPGSYARAIRAIYNFAIDKKVAYKDDYPFGKNKFEIGNEKRKSNALGNRDLIELYNFQKETGKTINDNTLLAINVFLFSYLCNGMNFTDLSKLKQSDIQLDTDYNRKYFEFFRGKTAEKTRNSRLIRIYLNNFTESIIREYNNTEYIFPIIDKSMDEEVMNKRIKEKRNRLNKKLKVICQQLQISNFSMDSARHSFSTSMRNIGYDYHDIRDLMGHAPTITEGYVDSSKLNLFKRASDDIMKTLVTENEL